MTDLIAEYRMPKNLCTLLGFNADEVETIDLYASDKGKLYYKVVGYKAKPIPGDTEYVEVESWYEVNNLKNQQFPISSTDAGLKRLKHQPLGQIYPYIEKLKESAHDH